MTALQAQNHLDSGVGATRQSSSLPLRIVLLQAVIAVAVAVVMVLLAQPAIGQATAALLAGLCVVVPGLAVATLFSQPVEPAGADELDTSALTPALSVVALLAGFLAALVLMGLVFAFLKPPALGFFSALVATQLAPIIAPALQDAQRRKKR